MTRSEGRFELGDFALQSGRVLPNAFLGYATHGTLNAARNNVIVYPTWYLGRHRDAEPYIGPGKALDPQRYCIVVPDMFTNGFSTSPSNCASPLDGINFPLVTPYDNVVAQHRMLTELFGVTGVDLALGFSMSGQQAYHWGALFPDFVKRICSICGSAKTTPHNWLYLNSYKTAMECADGWNNGSCKMWPPRLLAVIASIAATMAWSQDWYREGGHGAAGTGALNEFLTGLEGSIATWMPVDLYAQTLTWMAADVSANSRFDGNLDAALASITSRALIMPCDTDMYFRVADNEAEVAKMPNAELKVIRSSWGHMAGMPGANAANDAFVDAALQELLQGE
jgi:homoserine O-acetyltransferase/O-succinyltransferase